MQLKGRTRSQPSIFALNCHLFVRELTFPESLETGLKLEEYAWVTVQGGGTLKILIVAYFMIARLRKCRHIILGLPAYYIFAASMHQSYILYEILLRF